MIMNGWAALQKHKMELFVIQISRLKKYLQLLMQVGLVDKFAQLNHYLIKEH